MLHESQLRYFSLFSLWGTSEPETAQAPSPNICLVGCRRLSPSCRCWCHHPENPGYCQRDWHFPAFQPQDLQEKPSLVLHSLRSCPVFFLDDHVQHDLIFWFFEVFQGSLWHSWFSSFQRPLFYCLQTPKHQNIILFLQPWEWELVQRTRLTYLNLFIAKGGNQRFRSYWQRHNTKIQARSSTEAKTVRLWGLQQRQEIYITVCGRQATSHWEWGR